MSVNVGTATGYLDLDISGFLAGLKSANSEATKEVNNLSTSIGKGFETVGSKLTSAGKTLTAGITMPIAAGVTSAVKEFAGLEQAIGGVETLFKGSANSVIANSETAYMRAGASATSYMEQVTSFSARLLQSTGGDTEKAAKIADMAMVDMSDNANKFGTNIGSIQDAYQGFAKDNYTMLDNLKLGYGGTKTEMERLLIEAGKISGIEYNIDNLSDVYEAVHVIQNELGITGTTALEATETISGAFGMAKASVKDFLAHLGQPGADMEKFKQNMIDSLKVVVDNIKRVLGTIWENIPLEGWQKKLIAAMAVAGPLLLAVGKISTGISGVLTTFGKIPGAITKVKSAFTLLSTALAGITAPVALAVAGVAALGIGAIALGKHLSKDALPEVERFGEGISETTQEAVGSFMDMTEEANIQLKELSWGQQEVTAEMAEDMRTKQEEITNTLLTAISERHQEEIAATQEQMANLDMLSEEQKASILEKTNQRFEEESIAVEEGHARINEIMQLAADEGRAITQEESDEILKIREGMTEQAVEVMSENEVEQKLILERMKSNAETISAAEAAEVVRNATQKKDDVIKEANDQFDETYKWAIRQRDELGTLSDEEAADVIAAAEKQRDESVAAAEEMHDKVIEEAQSQAGEHVNEVDWETGEVLSKWEVMKADVATKAGEMKDDVVQKAKDMARDAKSSFEDLRKSAGEKFGNVATTIRDKMEDARRWVSEKIQAIKGFFSNLRLKLPKIEVPPLPHFSISGKFSLNPPSVPSFGIEWYKKAMGGGMILDSPTIFGFNSKTGKLLAGGEAGSETVVGTKSLLNMIKTAVHKSNIKIIETITGYFDVILDNIRNSNEKLLYSIGYLVTASCQFAQACEGLSYIAYNGFVKSEQAIVENNKNKPASEGGDTFNFYSPKPIDEIEAANQLKKTKRDLSEGF